MASLVPPSTRSRSKAEPAAGHAVCFIALLDGTLARCEPESLSAVKLTAGQASPVHRAYAMEQWMKHAGSW